MKIQNEIRNNLESRTVKTKVKEIAAISFFTVIAAVSSILLADIIVFPITHLAVRNVDVFNLLFKNILLLLLFLGLFFTFFRKYRKLADDGLKPGNILLYFLKRPLHYFILFLSLSVISILMITVLYMMFSMNYYYLYKISGGL